MTLRIQEPSGGPDVTRRNKREILYIKGDENTSESMRIVPQDLFVNLEINPNGTFQAVGMVTENLMLDENLNLMFDESLNPMYAEFPTT